MKKQLLTIRMLLVVAMLCLGVNVTWADPTTIYERGYTTDWSDADLTDWVAGGTYSRTESSIDGGFKVYATASTETYEFTKTFSAKNNTILTLNLQWYANNPNGNSQYSYITFGDIRIRFSSQGGNMWIKFGDEDEQQLITSAGTGLRGATWNVILVVNQYLHSVRYSIASTKYNSGTAITGTGSSTATFSSIKLGYKGGYNYDYDQSIKSIKITENTKATVTTEYVDGSGNKLKADVVEEKDFNTSFTPTYDATINTEFKKYTYASGGGAATVTDDVTRSIVYNTAWQAAYADYTIHVAEDYEIESASVSNWSTNTSGRYTPIISTADGNKFMTVNQDQRGNNGCTVTGTLFNGAVSSGNDFTLVFDVKLAAASDRASDITTFTINDAANNAAILKFTASATGSTIWNINESTTQTVTMGTGDWYTAKLVRIGTSTTLKIIKKSDSSVAFAEAVISNLSETGGLGKMSLVTARYNANLSMDNILVRDVAVGDLTLSTAPTISSTDNKTYVDGSLEITLACETAGASIRYTTDGTDPTSSSTLYSAPFDITETTTVKAIAIKDYAMSAVTSATYTKVYDLANVTGAETWDWSKTDLNIQLTGDNLSSLKDTHFVLKNIEFFSSGTEIPAAFGDAQKLSVKGEWAFRSAYKCFQGSEIKFTTEVAGKLSVDFSNTGSNSDRYLTVNGENTSYKSGNTSSVSATSIPVAAGEVIIGSSANYLRFYKVTFTPYTEVELAILDCKTYETSEDFATYIDGGTYASAAEVYAAHTAWQVENGTPSKAILDNTVTSADHWSGDAGTLSEGADYAGAPDTYYLSRENNSYNVNQIVYQLPAGVYRASAWTYSSAAKWRKIYVSKVPAQGSWTDLIYPETSDEGWVELSGEFTLTEPANIAFGLYADAQTGRTAGFDNWTLTKIESVSATIGSTGYTTFASSYPLDLSNLPDGITAYTASVVGESEVTFTPATTAVAAGTGLLLNGTADTSYDIPVVASGEIISGNKMVGCPAATDLTPSESYYVLVNNNGTAEFRPLSGTYTNNKVTIPAGKAYLDVNAGTARALSIALDNEEVTGINNVQGSGVKTQSYYNLNGQRVAQPTKGLYIINGRKVVVK